MNVGSQGNTSAAAVSLSESVQILSPNGFEKLEVGTPYRVQFQSSGLAPVRPVGQWVAGTSPVDRWTSGAEFQLTGTTFVSTTAVDTSTIANPAPSEVYQRYANINGVNESLRFTLPVRNGTYNVRLHFAEPNPSVVVGSRIFDVQLQSTTVVQNLDVRAASGALYRALTRSFPGISVSNGVLDVRLVNKTVSGAILSAIEITADEAVADPAPKVTLQASSDSGATWSTIATNVPLDVYGRGEFTWMPTQPTNARTALLRVVSEQGLLTSDVSDQAFEVVNNGADYFISSNGDDANGGKTPDRPMRTIQAMLDVYDLDPGDTIHVASGNYPMLRNAVITNSDSGVRILGPADASAVFQRQNTSTSPIAFGFQLINADSVTIDSVSITGAYSAVFADQGSDSDDLVVKNSRLFGNYYAGIEIGNTNDRLLARDNVIFGIPGGTFLDNQIYGIALERGISAGGTGSGFDHVIEGNDIFDNGTGIFMPGRRSIARNNEIHGNATGIYARGNLETEWALIQGNEIYANTTTGINSGGVVTIEGNEVYNHTGTSFAVMAGNILAAGTPLNAVVRNNVVRNNTNGIETVFGSGARIEGNRVFGNTNIGIQASGRSEIVGNRIYSNSIGVRGTTTFAGPIASNILYVNTNRAILVENNTSSGSLTIQNNTIYQTVGDAIRLQTSSRNVRVHNNIVWVLSGYGLFVENGSQTGFVSNSNLLRTSADPNARVGFWNGNQSTLSDWQTASSQDATSIVSDPLFIDIDGADNRLGFAAGVDGGIDDNFQRLQGSPATDRGDAWNAWRQDIEGLLASDDAGPTNVGRPTLSPVVTSNNLFTATGIAQTTWRSNGTSFAFTFPSGFTFPFYGTTYNSVFVSTEGFLQFGSQVDAGESANSSNALIAGPPRIAPLWDNMRTNGIGDDIFVDASVNGQLKFRWNATHEVSNSDLQFAVVLFSNGEIRFDYGPGNTGLTPTVGVASGNGQTGAIVGAYDGASSLSSSPSVLWTLTPGFRDLGAHEYAGNSGDTTSPQIVSTSPLAIGAQNAVASGFTQLILGFSEPMLASTTLSSLLYDLRSAGANNTFGDTDDNVIPVSAQYDAVAQQLRLVLVNGALAAGKYRLSISGDVAQTLRDVSGNPLDGDSNGSPGGAYVRTFDVITNDAPVLSGGYEFPTITSGANATNNGALVSTILSGRVSDPDGPGLGMAVVSVDNANGVWEYALNGTTFVPVASALTNGNVLVLAANASTRVRFRPNQGFIGFASIDFRAWDRSDGNAPGSSVSPSLIETRSFSVASLTSRVPVISGNTAPTGITLSANTIAEGTPVGTQIGLLSTSDANPGDSFVYALVAGSGSQDNSSFEIVGNALRSTDVFDFETKNQYSIRVRTTDSGGLVFERNFEIAVTDASETPITTVPDAGNTPVNQVLVLDVLANDVDPTSNANRASLEIVTPPTTGQAIVLSDGRVEYRPATDAIYFDSFSYRVQGNDGVWSNVSDVQVQVRSAFFNVNNPYDVDFDGFVSPLDVLALINDINANGSRRLPTNVPDTRPYLDPNNNGSIEPLDVLMIINFINSGGGSNGEGESDHPISEIPIDNLDSALSCLADEWDDF
ncbi:MAG: right-handed parallel beta-helix repeat-containing protein [Pirellula sp.]|nr:right-handed parallel beta-helix repeat-containing protein [Pirellula sp.]